MKKRFSTIASFASVAAMLMFGPAMPATDSCRLQAQSRPSVDDLPRCGVVTPVDARARDEAKARSSALESISLTESPQSTIDMMIVYTTAARDAAHYLGLSGAQALDALIDDGTAFTNQIFQNSKINARLRIVHKEEVFYTESGSLALDLGRLQTPGDGFLDAVHSLRDQHNADLVCLLTAAGDYSGYASIISNAAFAQNDELGFSVMLWFAITPSDVAVFAHEIGHNMGCHHDKVSAPGGGLYSYSYGNEFFGTDGVKYGTVMSVGDGRRIQYFSNPLVFYQGAPTGVPEGRPDSSDTARTINNVAPLVASYRPREGTGLVAEYFDNSDFTNLKMTRTDAEIDFNWKKASPDQSIAPNTFSVRWTGEIRSTTNEEYTFYALSNDGMKVWIDDQIVVDNRAENQTVESSGSFFLNSSLRYTIKVEYTEKKGKASAKLFWSSASQPKRIIPQARLHPFSIPRN